MKTLYFFTATFPYGFRESFIETEINYLCKSFDHVTIIPLAGSGSPTRSVPENCKVVEPIIQNKLKQYLLAGFNLKLFVAFFEDLFRQKAIFNRYKFKTTIIAYLHTTIIFKSPSLREILSQIQGNDIMYFYWGKGSVFIIPFIKSIKAKKVVRFHGAWDLWEESKSGYAPQRKTILEQIDLIVNISEIGQKYLLDKYDKIKHKSIISRLGTLDWGESRKSNDGFIRVLSCSSIIPLKRVHLIYEAIKCLSDKKIEWTHIGDGPLFEDLNNRINNCHTNHKVHLLGRLRNEDVVKYYQNNPVDVFINVSTTEGVPVALMEAISFNVPVIGTNVGGTSEVVTEETGVLLNANPEPQEIADSIKKVVCMKINPKQYWCEKFNAEKNYLSLSDLICKL